MLPTDPRLEQLSVFQELWISGQILKKRKSDYELQFGHVKTICSFIDPVRAEKAFTEGERSDNSGFLADLAKLNPNFKPAEYADILEE